MKTLIVGKPFFGLEAALELRAVQYEIASTNEVISQSIPILNYENIIVVDANLLLNNASLDLIYTIYKHSSADATIVWWTREPFWDQSECFHNFFLGRKTHNFNVKHEIVFPSIFSQYFGVGGASWSNRTKSITLPEKNVLKDRFDKGRRDGHLVCAYASCFNDRRLDVPGSLMVARCDAILRFWREGICKVYGKNWGGRWPVNVEEETRQGTDNKTWGRIKVEQSRPMFSFSICLENYLGPNYVTEKFAQAIESYLLPIYTFGNGLEDYFNQHSAIALNKDGSNLEAVVEEVNTMDFESYYYRLSNLMDQYNSIICNVQSIDEQRNKPAKSLVALLLDPQSEQQYIGTLS